MAAKIQPLMLSLLLLHSLFGLPLSTIPSIDALNVGIQPSSSAISVSNSCSRTCESDFCSVPPFLRYGKYCGLLYGGCPGEKPCDGLDACCFTHDACVGAKNNDYLSVECNQNFLECISDFRDSGRPSFKGNRCSVDEVVDILSVVIEAGVLAGRVLHKP